ncbi:MAG: hypothetical protein ACD_23C00752G0003 [uncultured bacterium]|nr:MAG: hypothetical protein ACD_23C00752G0003 [uncultured bacterium]
MSAEEECRKEFEAKCRFMRVEFSLEWDAAGFYAQLETDRCYTWFKLGFEQAKTMQTFKDWAGQQIPYRMVPAEPDADVKVVCEIDPHSSNQWSSFGRGHTNEAALKSATEAWNAFDRQT